MANRIKTVILLALLSGLLIFVGGLLGGRTGMTIALVIAVAMNIGSYWFSDRIILGMYRAQEVNESQAPDIYAMVSDLAHNANIPMPKVYIIQDDSPNAFATGRNPDNAVVALTTGILRILDRDELSGVVGHELGHIKNRDILIQTVAATIGAAITYLAYFGMFFGGSDDEEGGSPITGILMIFLAPLAATLIQMAISRSREYLADRSGAQFCGNPMYLARALDKLRRGVDQVPMRKGYQATENMFIVNPFAGMSMSSLFSTHPATEERIARLQEMAGR
jgi:heat shock protein HtpX